MNTLEIVGEMIVDQLKPDAACDLDYALNTTRSGVVLRTVMSDSFAFGGSNAVFVEKRLVDPEVTRSRIQRPVKQRALPQGCRSEGATEQHTGGNIERDMLFRFQRLLADRGIPDDVECVALEANVHVLNDAIKLRQGEYCGRHVQRRAGVAASFHTE